MKHSVTIRLGAFASEAVAAGHANGVSHRNGRRASPDDLLRAIRLYLKDKDRHGPGWAYPGFLQERETDPEVELRFDVEDSLWRALELEAESQHVSVTRLLEHVALYYAAELDAGRVTARILEDLDED